MKSREKAYTVWSPEFGLLIWTTRRLRREAIVAFLDGTNWTFEHWIDLGYKVRRVEVVVK